MSWTGRPDDASACNGPHGAVTDDEAVARIFVVQVPDQGYVPFARGDLCKPVRRAFSNVCGSSDGLSVDRCSGLDDEELRRRSAARASQKNASRAARGKAPNQFPGGAHMALTKRLRALRAPNLPDVQAVFIYDDPLVENPEHAVIRISDDVDEAQVAGLIDDVVAAFDRAV